MLGDWSKGISASRVQRRTLASAHSSPGSSQEGLTEQRIRRSHWPILFAECRAPNTTLECLWKSIKKMTSCCEIRNAQLGSGAAKGLSASMSQRVVVVAIDKLVPETRK